MTAHTQEEPVAQGRHTADDQRVAVIGMGCRLPGAVGSPAALWELLASGRDAVGHPPPQRARLYPQDPHVPVQGGPPASEQGGYLDNVSGFDAAFFGVSGREADVLDPQHRLLLEVTWEALENAGLPPERLQGTRTAVLTGISYSDYMDALAGRSSELEGSILTNGHCVAPGRISYLLGLEGPCAAVDTACSSSLVAVHLACQALRAGECDVALAGGVTLTFQPRITRSFARLGMLSPTGRCRTFDAAADGFVRGEGCGVVVLKRLADAVHDGDRVLAVVRASGTNQDGASENLATPSAAAQRALYRQVLDLAGVDPHTVGMIETHGTGTPVGDPVEFASLAEVYGTGPGQCALASVKTNLGHLEPAAGVTGLIKTVLCLQHGVIPPNLHFTRWNPSLAADGTRLFVPTGLTPWPVSTPTRLAAVSSFGFSGTNAHVLVEQAPEISRRGVPPARRSPHHASDVFLVAAGSQDVLPAAAGRLADWIEGDGAAVPLRDIAHTLALRRSAGRGRLSVLASARDELVASLRSFAAGQPSGSIATGTVAVSRRPVWVFSGQGSQWPGMCRGLYVGEPAFREALVRADACVTAHGGPSVLDVVRQGTPVTTCGTVQPVLFALQIALAALWRAHGVEPAAVIGHSMGEVAAAVVAGALSLSDGALIICRRSALLSRISGRGSMLSVGLDARSVRDELASHPAPGNVSVAVLSAPDSTVVAGDPLEISRLAADWDARGVAVFPVAVDVASHCSQVDEILPELRSLLGALSPRRPTVPFYSTVLEDGDTPAFDAEYWCANLRQPVRFTQAVAAAAADRHQLYVEISPHPVVTHAIAAGLAGTADAPLVLPTLRREEDEQSVFRAQLAGLHCAGVNIDWRPLYGDGNLVDTPTITFDRRHHWALTAPSSDRPTETTARTSGSEDVAIPAALPGTHTEVPGTPVRHVWRADTGTDAVPWLADHQVHAAPVLPGALHCALALTAACEVFAASAREVEVTDLHFTELLRLDPHTELAVVVTMNTADQAHCEILAREDGGDWSRRADATVRRLLAPPKPRSASVRQMATRHPRAFDPADLYRSLRRRGLEHGPSFSGITRLATTSQGDSFWATVKVPHEAEIPALPLAVHPVLLDLCAQLAVAPLIEQDGQEPVLPVEMRNVRITGDPATAVHCHARVTEATASSLVAQVRLLDSEGAVLLSIEGLRFARGTGPAALVPATWLLDIGWRSAPAQARTLRQAPGDWVVIGEANGSADSLAGALRASGAGASVCDRPLDGTPLGSVRDLLAEHLAAAPSTTRGVVLLCADTPGAEPAEHALRRTRRAVGALQAIAARTAGPPPRLYVVTRGARPVRADDTVDPGQSALRGLVRVAALEHPEIRPVLLDTDPHTGIGLLVRELLTDGADDEVALRGSERYVARLGYAPPGGPQGTCVVRHGIDGFRLSVGAPGDLGSLELTAARRRRPDRGEVEVGIMAAGLNFRDVLTAMGLLPPDKDGRSPIGFECSGVVTAVGAGVRAFSVGDEVIAVDLRGGAFGSFVTLPASSVAPVPSGVDPVAAAGLPVAFMTAWYALRHVARLSAGERVLIHSATGGTGLAAIAVARSVGAEVLATAGSEDKRRCLRAMKGVTRVMDSRTLHFGEQTRTATGGEGVDVVLNSLSGAAIRTGLETLRPFGRFVELGVRDILSDTPLGMLPLRHNVSLSTVDLIELQRDRPDTFGAVLQEVLSAFRGGQLKPLHPTTYPLSDATRAFRTMAAADHIGKLVLTVPSEGETTVSLPDSDLTVRKGGAYIVTGGLRGLGLEVARWLASHGAGHLVLNGRTPPTAQTALVLSGIRHAGTKVTVALGDIAERQVAEHLVTAATADGVPLYGIVHCAMVLEDAALTNITHEQLDHVWAPKALGAWHLHHAAQGHTLDWFALFSSMASLLGNPGQGAYAAANAWLDGFARQRTQQGLRTLSINWGPWGEVGVATDFALRGYQTLTTALGLSAMDTLLSHRHVQAGVIPGPPDTWIPPAGRELPFFSELAQQAEEEAAGTTGAGRDRRTVHSTGTGSAVTDSADSEETSEEDVRSRLAALSAGSARRDALEEFLTAHIRTVLRLDNSSIDPQIPLKSLGFDSLLSMELRVRIEKALAVRLPSDFVKRHPTPAALAAALAEHLALDSPAAQG